VLNQLRSDVSKWLREPEMTKVACQLVHKDPVSQSPCNELLKQKPVNASEK
jgi:hypothetical protein